MSHVIKARTRSDGEILTRERCYIRERLNDPQVPAVSVAECRVPPGVTTELHRLDVDEWYLIDAGRGLMEVNRQAPVAVGPGDVVVIPRGSPQRISNAGPGELRFQCICMPRFTREHYEPLESAQTPR